MTTAYDYTAQRWTYGAAARALREMQARETLAILESPEGESYALFVGGGRSLAEMIASYRTELAQLSEAQR